MNPATLATSKANEKRGAKPPFFHVPLRDTYYLRLAAFFAGAFFAAFFAGRFLATFLATAFFLAGAFFTAFLAGRFLAAFLAGAFLAGAFFFAAVATFPPWDSTLNQLGTCRTPPWCQTIFGTSLTT